jgi:hypothetical protein
MDALLESQDTLFTESNPNKLDLASSLWKALSGEARL